MPTLQKTPLHASYRLLMKCDRLAAQQRFGTTKIMSLGELRRNPGCVIDEAADDHESVLITRDRGKPAAVLMSLEDFASHEETAYLLRSPANAKRLLEGIAELESGAGSKAARQTR